MLIVQPNLDGLSNADVTVLHATDRFVVLVSARSPTGHCFYRLLDSTFAAFAPAFLRFLNVEARSINLADFSVFFYEECEKDVFASKVLL